MPLALALLLLLLLAANAATAQLAIRNGVCVPTRDTLWTLIVFAEVDFEDGPCSGNLTEDFKGNWPKDRHGRTLPPAFAHEFFDRELKPGATPTGFITRFYHEASFGQYVMLGDYLPQVVTVPCRSIRSGDNGLSIVLGALEGMAPASPTLHTAGGLPLSAFDRWKDAPQGEPKTKQPDGRIDLLYIVWRNNRMLSGSHTKDCAGYGVTKVNGRAFKDMKGVSAMASFNVSSSAHCAEFITVAEHLHGLFGGNHWHSSGGRGMHTFLIPPASYGLTGQHGSTMQAASGWDRWMMDWVHPSKAHAISALDAAGKEIPADLTLETHPLGGTFILRDFMRTGDAIRIRLPHVGYGESNPVKGQYLWLENRRMETHSDRYLSADCSNSGNGRFPRGTPGVYAYIQVGKDQREGAAGIYSARHSEPNGLASPFFPLPAEGRFDFRFRFDRLQEADHGLGCNWGNRNLPKDKPRSLPNPMSGLSDQYCMADFNQDGKLHTGDHVLTGLSRYERDSVIHDYHIAGDWMDAFSSATGKLRLGLATNPAPVPVLTYATDYEYRRFATVDGRPGAFENRAIDLNGLGIRMEELPSGQMRVTIRWDDYLLDGDVRWCGHLRLHPHAADTVQPSLLIGRGKKLRLERSGSPEFPEAIGKNRKGEWLFSDTTRLTALPGAVIEIGPRASLLIHDESILTLQPGSRLILRDRARLIIAKGAQFHPLQGSVVEMGEKAKVERK